MGRRRGVESWGRTAPLPPMKPTPRSTATPPARPRRSRVPTARVVEVFSSIQGEANLVGVRQIFLRFFGCNLRCDWCDAPETLSGHPPCRIEQTPGREDFVVVPNPLTVEQLVAAVERLAAEPHHSLSLTGGEPLLHARFLTHLLPALKPLGLPYYLETNGLLPAALAEVLPWIDDIAMDLKPPSCTHDPEPDWLEKHRAFLRIARERRLFLKIVVTADADEAELCAAFDLAAEEAPDAPLTLQPVTPFGPVQASPSMEQLLRWHALASRRLREVRILPQVHKRLRVL